MLGHRPVDRLAHDQMFMATFLTAETRPFAFTEGPPLPQMIEEEESDGDKSHMDVDNVGQSSSKN